MMATDYYRPLAVLVSGGLDSAVLVGQMSQTSPAVHPIYVRTGLAWESLELDYLRRFLAAIATTRLQPLVIFDQPVRDLYGDHWSMTEQVPDAQAPDEEFYLPGRNIVLLTKPLIWCRLHQVSSIVLGILKANPFPDATRDFFDSFGNVVSKAIGGRITIETPYSGMSKADVIRLGRDLPLQHTFSCVSPANGHHCGGCGKCAERGRAFLEAGILDPTNYVSRAWENTMQRPAHSRPWE